MYLDLSGGIDRAATMIWRSQNNGPGEERDEPREDSGSDNSDTGTSGTAVSSVGERVETVLEAAERAAADIRKDAERWAEQHMEETRRRADELAAQRVQQLSSITDELLARAQAVVRQSDDLIGALNVASRRAPSVPPPSPKANNDYEPAGVVSDGARLLAAQMAVAGSNREKVGLRLREEFGIDDPSAILDEAGL